MAWILLTLQACRWLHNLLKMHSGSSPACCFCVWAAITTLILLTGTSSPRAAGSAEQVSAANTEITAAPQQAAEADGTVRMPGTPTGEAPGRSTSAGLTISERVANLGHLLGLGGSASGEAAAVAGGISDAARNSSSKAASGGLKRFLSSNSMDASAARGLSRSSSGSQPMCLICLEPLTSEDFMVLPCAASWQSSLALS